jgi:hypothetical protein
MSRITDFYSGKGTDIWGRTLRDIQHFPAHNLAEVHNFIQWLFPLPEKSQFSPDAPVLTAADMQEFRASTLLKNNLLESFKVMADFYGLELSQSGVSKHEHFEACKRNWLRPADHNFLRISRMLRSLSLLGLQDEAKNFMAALEEVYADPEEVVYVEHTEKFSRKPKDIIGPGTLDYWRRAVNPPELRAPVSRTAPAP